jgi:hypothetical protein
MALKNRLSLRFSLGTQRRKFSGNRLSNSLPPVVSQTPKCRHCRIRSLKTNRQIYLEENNCNRQLPDRTAVVPRKPMRRTHAETSTIDMHHRCAQFQKPNMTRKQERSVETNRIPPAQRRASRTQHRPGAKQHEHGTGQTGRGTNTNKIR